MIEGITDPLDEGRDYAKDQRELEEQIKVEYFYSYEGELASSKGYVSDAYPHKGDNKYTDESIELRYDGTRWWDLHPDLACHCSRCRPNVSGWPSNEQVADTISRNPCERDWNTW